MSTGSPPAPEVASTATRASVAGRFTATIAPVEVSLWAQPTRSASVPSSSEVAGAVPGSKAWISGSVSHGAFLETVANLPENSP